MGDGKWSVDVASDLGHLTRDTRPDDVAGNEALCCSHSGMTSVKERCEYIPEMVVRYIGVGFVHGDVAFHWNWCVGKLAKSKG